MNEKDKPIQQLPSRYAYQQAVMTLQGIMDNEGGPIAHLAYYRERMDQSPDFTANLYGMLLNYAGHFEQEDNRNEYGFPIFGPLTRAALSGMIFGQMVNDRLYPGMNREQTYERSGVHIVIDNPEEYGLTLEGLAEEGLSPSGMVAVIGHKGLALLTDDAREIVTEWPKGLINPEENHRTFHYGLGVSLYVARDYQRRIQVEQVKRAVMSAAAQTGTNN